MSTIPDWIAMCMIAVAAVGIILYLNHGYHKSLEKHGRTIGETRARARGRQSSAEH